MHTRRATTRSGETEFRVVGDHGYFVAAYPSGLVLYVVDQPQDNTRFPYSSLGITRFDVAEYELHYRRSALRGQVDIVNIGAWTSTGYDRPPRSSARQIWRVCRLSRAGFTMPEHVGRYIIMTEDGLDAVPIEEPFADLEDAKRIVMKHNAKHVEAQR